MKKEKTLCIYIVFFLDICMPLLESMLLSVFLLTPVEIGSSNASPG